VQLSGLAAEDARDPQIMMAGFVLLGAGTVVFGAGLGRVTAPRSAGPWLVVLAGVASVAAGLFRRDHMLLAAVFASRIAGPYDGVVQRIAVTLPLAAEILIAGRMLTLPVTGSAAGPGVTPSQEVPVNQGG
jgi:hypothetical protein